MFRKKRLWFLNHRHTAILLLIVTLAPITLIVLNYFTLKALSATRAYTNGESLYSKGQKDACRFLILYMNTGNPHYWEQFNKEIRVPLGFRLYRDALDNGDEKKAELGLILARFPRDDWEDVNWMYNNFKNSFLMRDAIRQWSEADILIKELVLQSVDIHTKIVAGTMTFESRSEATQKLNELSLELSSKERAYVDVLGDSSRTLVRYLFLINIILTVLLIGSVGSYAIVMLTRLTRSNLEIEEKNAVKDKFLHIASHELKTPITSMKATMQLIGRLLEKQENRPLQPLINQANKQVQRLTLLVSDLLDVTKIQGGQLQLRKEMVKVQALIKGALEQVPQNSHEIIVEGDLHGSVFGDQQRLEQVIVNFLSNGIKYSPENSKLILIVERTDDAIKICVKDFGIGIPEENREHIFDKFFRVREISDKYYGMGLGLYISSEIIKNHGGEIGVSSRLNEGSTFWFKLPALPDAHLQEHQSTFWS